MRHFQFTDWPEHGQNLESFNDFIQQVHKTKTQFGVEGPICVHCSAGTGSTGVFIAVANIIDRISLERVVDVFTTAKLLRTQRHQMIETKEDYLLCYQAALEFITSHDSYAMQ